MVKRLLAALLAACLLCGPAALAATPAQQADADLLRALGLFEAPRPETTWTAI